VGLLMPLTAQLGASSGGCSSSKRLSSVFSSQGPGTVLQSAISMTMLLEKACG
jgi:hypothetical protein